METRNGCFVTLGGEIDFRSLGIGICLFGKGVDLEIMQRLTRKSFELFWPGHEYDSLSPSRNAINRARGHKR